MNEPEATEPERKVEIPMAYIEARKKVRAARPSQSDICSALPEENAVEVVDERTGEKRIDYKGVKIKNADGTLNKYGKNLIDMHQPHHRVGAEVQQKFSAGDYAQPVREEERKQYLSPEVAERIAKARGLMRVHVPRGKIRFRGRDIFEAGSSVPNLWFDEDGRLVRIALVGTAARQRVEVYSA